MQGMDAHLALQHQSKIKMANDKRVVVLLNLVLLLFLVGCKKQISTTEQGVIKKTRQITLNDSVDQVANIMEGLQSVENKGLLYGIDFRTQRPFKISVSTGNVEFLSSKGRGPKELSLPAQVTIKNDSVFYVYDTAQDIYAKFSNDEIIEKYPGLIEQGIWLRNTYGEIWNNQLVTGIVEPGRINSLNFDDARALSIYDIKSGTTRLTAKLSPSIDKLDNAYKYPVIKLDKEAEVIYFVFSADYSVMKYDLNNDSTSVFSSYSPSNIRIRSKAVSYNETPTPQTAKEFGLDLSLVVGLEIIEDKLVVVWQNGTEKYYEKRGASNELRDYFGVIYDLEGKVQPKEINLPGKLIGSYGNQLLIEESDDLDNYVIGFYNIVED